MRTVVPMRTAVTKTAMTTRTDLHDTGAQSLPDGTALATYRWLPRGRPRGCVYVLHGMLEHAGRYAPLAEYLTGRGYAVFSHDHRGHGRTASPDGGAVDVAHVADSGGDRLLVKDAEACIAAVTKEYSDVPLFVLGHSLGSLVARSVAMRAQRLALKGAPSLAPAGYVLIGTTGPQPALTALGSVALGALGRVQKTADACPVARKLVFGPHNAHFRPTRTDLDWLCHLPELVDDFKSDPLCPAEASLAFWRDVSDLQWRVNSPEMLGLRPGSLYVPGGLFAGVPMLFVSGSEDGVSQFGPGARRAAALARAAGSTDVTCTLVAGLRHEILNISDAIVYSHLIRWLDARCGDERDPMNLRA